MTKFDLPSFTKPEFELVAIHPEHFLPCGSVLPIFHSTNSTPTLYVTAKDRCLRESPSPNSPRLPSFCHVTKRSNPFEHLNVFLVALNAEIKFQRYLHIIGLNPPTTPLPADVLDLMHLTIKLVEQLYWQPVSTKGSQGEEKTKPGHRRKFHFPDDMDLETRKEYGRALMSGHGILLPFHPHESSPLNMFTR